MFRKREDVLLQLGEREAFPHRDAVGKDVQRRVGVVHDPLAVGTLDPGGRDVPFLRHRPVQHRRPARHLGHLERDPLSDQLERAAEAVAGDASRDRKELANQAVELAADPDEVRLFMGVDGRHRARQL